MKTSLGEIDLFCFDWSGVISDDKSPVHETTMRILEEEGIARIGLEDFFALPPRSLKQFLFEQGIDISQKEIDDRFVEVYQEVVENLTFFPMLYPDVPMALETLKGRNAFIVVVSAHAKSCLEKEIDAYRLRRYFSEIYGGTSHDKSKGLRQICLNYRISLKRAVMIGDTIFDIRSAKEVGMHALALFRGYNSYQMLAEEKPEILVETLRDLMIALGVR